MLKQNCAWPLIKRYCFLCAVLFLSSAVYCQYTIKIELSVPPVKEEEQVFIAGSFNNWSPGDDNFRFAKQGDKYYLQIPDAAAGSYDFKFTKGDWSKVECTAGGNDIANRTVKIESDSSFSFSIEGWKDDFASASPKHTLSNHVQVMDDAFEIPQLDRQRRIWLYLPEGYKNSKKRYPVLYMHDGQNVFDNATSGFGEWGVDECLDSLIKIGKPPCIVVAIDNAGDKRMNEYNPYEFTWKDSSNSITFTPEGDKYIEFLAKTLKPYIDKNYRTLSSRENTIIAGSSMGGLISYYAMLKYPSVFGKAGIFSPAFWTASGIDDATDSFGNKADAKFFFFMGETEGKKHVDNMVNIQEKIGANSSSVIYSVVDPDGKHNEDTWRKWFPAFYIWIMADGTNVPGGL